MWQSIKINDQNWFFLCFVEENSMKFYLYNLKVVWSEECSVSGIIERARQLNKRICYDSQTVLKTLKSTVLTSASLENEDNGYILFLKYHIVGRPFNFEWKLKPLNADDFQKLVTYPLLMSIHQLTAQIKELKDEIHKKDIEIKQYKEEGFILKRKTVATEPFDEDDFKKRFSQCDELSRGFLNISECVKADFPKIQTGDKEKIPEEKPKEISTYVSCERLLKKSPNKKRKYFADRRQRMESLLKARKEALEYESSQSQGMSQSPPAASELEHIFQSLDELNAKRFAPSM